MHMKANTIVESAKADVPHSEPIGKCHCGGVTVFRHRFHQDPPRVECTNCGYEDPKLRDLGWVDALFRKDAAAQLLQSQDLALELLDALMYLKGLAIGAGRFYDAVRFEFMASILDIRNDEIDELDSTGWFSDPSNLAINMRPSQADRDEIVCEHEDLQRLIDQAKARVQ